MSAVRNLDAAWARGALPRRDPYGDKNAFGCLLNISGSRDMPGAAVLSGLAALRCGVGLHMLASVPQVVEIAQTRLLESLYMPLLQNRNGQIVGDAASTILSFKRATAILTGCGLGVSENGRGLMRRLLWESALPMVIDADGLNNIAPVSAMLPDRAAPLILTPHAREMARLCDLDADYIDQNRLTVAREFSEKWNVTLVLKGSTTVIASGGQTFVHDLPNPGMAKGGSGDLLAGCIASFLAQGAEALDAAALGVYCHGQAGLLARARYGVRAMLPSDVIEQIPAVLRALEPEDA